MFNNRAMLSEKIDNFRIAICPIKYRAAIHIFNSIWISAMLKQKLDYFDVPSPARLHQWGGIELVTHIDIGPSRDQKLHSFKVSFSGCRVKRRSSSATEFVNICAMSNRPFH